MNLVEPEELGQRARGTWWPNGAIAGAELVGLVPRSVLDRTDPARWAELDLAEEQDDRVASPGCPDPAEAGHCRRPARPP